MAAITLLKTDHKTVEKLFKQFEKLGDRASSGKATVVDQIIMEAAKRAAPTRPHPKAPDTPPGNILVGLPTALLDMTVTAGKRAVRR